MLFDKSTIFSCKLPNFQNFFCSKIRDGVMGEEEKGLKWETPPTRVTVGGRKGPSPLTRHRT